MTADLTPCTHCGTWRSKPCGEGCHWGLASPIKTAGNSKSDKALEMYAAGIRVKRIAEETGLSTSWIYTLALRAGLTYGNGRPRRNTLRTPETDPMYARDTEIVTRYQAGENTPALAEAFGLSRERVCQVLRRNNVIEYRNERRREAREALLKERAIIAKDAADQRAAEEAEALHLAKDKGLSFARIGRHLGWTGEMVRRVCADHGFVADRHGRHRDFTPRIITLRDMRAAGYSLSKSVEIMRAKGDSVTITWIYHHWSRIWPNTTPRKDRKIASTPSMPAPTTTSS